MRELPEKIMPVQAEQWTDNDRTRLVDRVFFGLGTIAAIYLAVEFFLSEVVFSATGILPLITGWVLLAYLALPRLHRGLASLYVPKYYIGRTRTSDGLLGDPVNLAVMGSRDQITAMMETAGWTQADPVDVVSSWRIVHSTLTRRSYHSAPVSPLYLFEKSQDMTYQQEVAGNPTKRHHIRFWRCPPGWLLPGGRQVDWLASATYDRAIGLSYFTLQVTHRIDADIDVERDYVLNSVTATQVPITVERLKDFTTSYHCRNGGGDTIRTDGMLPVLDARAAQGVPPPIQPSRSRRPFSILWGVAMAWAAAVINPIAIVTTEEANYAATTHISLASGLWGGTIVTVGLATWLTRRSDPARIALMVTSLFVTAAWAMWVATVAKGAEATWLAMAATLSILQVVALSSPSAQKWTRQKR